MNITKSRDFDSDQLSVVFPENNFFIFPCYGNNEKPLYLQTPNITLSKYTGVNDKFKPRYLLPLDKDTNNGSILINCLKNIDDTMNGPIRIILEDKLKLDMKDYKYMNILKENKINEKDIVGDNNNILNNHYKPFKNNFDIDKKTGYLKTKLFVKNNITKTITEVPVKTVEELKMHIRNNTKVKSLLRGNNIWVMRDEKMFGITFTVTQIKLIMDERTKNTYAFDDESDDEFEFDL